MPQLQEATSLSQVVPPFICFGMLFMGLIIFSFIYFFMRDRLYLTMSILALVGSVFVFGEAIVLPIAAWLDNPVLAMQFNRMEHVAIALFLFAIPYMLDSQLVIGPRWRKANRVVMFAGLFIAFGFILTAFLAPDLYVSVTNHREDWMTRPGEYGRGIGGPLYDLRDALLALLILYTVGCFIADMIRQRRLRYLLSSFLGILLAVYGAAVDLAGTYSANGRAAFDIFAGLKFSRFVAGITLFILFSMAGTLRRFLDLARNTEQANERAQREAEKNLTQNLFIRGVLTSSSETLLSKTESLSRSIAEFTDNSQEQAAATEEISASIAGTSDSALGVKESAEKQLSGMENLTQTLGKLTGSTDALSRTMSQALSMINEVSANAKSGEESLGVMNESMHTIQGSSSEITGIIEVINDISDRINLLALNATIEAARAGEHGRGFAVVAGEIGKLADATAVSIKDINDLIRRNEKEIGSGMQNTAVVVSRINAIIKDIGGVVSAFSELAARAEGKAQAHQVVVVSVQLVKGRAEHITRAMNEQSASIAAVSRSIESINGLTQTNAERIQMITESSRSLVDMVNTLRKGIEEFSLKNSAASDEAAPTPARRPVLQGTGRPAPGFPSS
ncbi:MAG: methyl-accepting chemotaxis protein [Spirochaetia bacterium]